MAYLYVRCYNYRHCIQPDFLKKAGIQRFRKSRNTELPKKREYRFPEKKQEYRVFEKREHRRPGKHRQYRENRDRIETDQREKANENK